MSRNFNIESLEKSFLVYEGDEYLGEVTMFSEGLINRLNEVYEENDYLHRLLDEYRKRNDYFVVVLSDCVKQGYDIDLEELFEKTQINAE